METLVKEEIQNGWLRRCNEMLAWNPKPSKEKFIRSVLGQIEAAPDVFPTKPQANILGKIYQHLHKRNMSDVEKQVLADLGILP